MPQYYLRNITAFFISIFPLILGFTACMLALGDYRMDLWSLATLAAATLLYKPCGYISMRLWKDAE